MAKHTPLSVLHKFYDAERVYTSAPAGSNPDFTPVGNMLSSDFYMEQSSELPWAGTYHGPESFKSFFDQASEWCTIDVRDPEILEKEGSDKIVVLSTIYYFCRKTGETPSFPLSQTFVIDTERGLIREIRSFYWDIKKLNVAMGYAK
ncbi:uncharacterized protein AB675_209 [Cyphellophora attinorum]|uniref:SnoaL-like domain-containing protein n=1 Tax=Cyphellophora attinorum TaxID=1664694 RepID=A0A0N1NYT5_9EURO|nr:uncharacterized protein AB675_209 [Phialophora attinorum]KPI37696.1 hypothetical protein AB675_209 [Phialophora attinorum]